MEAVAERTAVSQVMSDEELLAMITAAEPKPDPKLKVSFCPDTYRKAITFVAGVAPKRATLPILSMIRCQANGSTVLHATDLDIFASVEMPEAAAIDGECLIPRAALLAALKSSKRSLTIDLRPKLMVDITADGMKQTVPSLPMEEAVPFPNYKPAVSFKVSAKLFKESLRRTAMAMSSDTTRYVLNGVAIEVTPSGVVLIGTDGRRLHTTELSRMDYDGAWAARIKQCEQDIKAARESHKGDKKGFTAIAEAERALTDIQRFTFIVPAETVEHLLKLPLVPCDILTIDADTASPKCGFHYDCIKLISKTVEGTFPNYRQVIPPEMKEKIHIEADELAAAVNRAKVACTEKSNSVKLSFSRHKLALSTGTEATGKSSVELATNYVGPDLCVALNPKYIMDALSALKGLDIEFHIIDELSPVKLTHGSTLAVIMPMRLS